MPADPADDNLFSHGELIRLHHRDRRRYYQRQADRIFAGLNPPSLRSRLFRRGFQSKEELMAWFIELPREHLDEIGDKRHDAIREWLGVAKLVRVKSSPIELKTVQAAIRLLEKHGYTVTQPSVPRSTKPTK